MKYIKKFYIDGPKDYNGGVHQIWGKGIYSLRQSRFIGQEHPHDICAADSNLKRLRETISGIWSDEDINWGIYSVNP